MADGIFKSCGQILSGCLEAPLQPSEEETFYCSETFLYGFG